MNENISFISCSAQILDLSVSSMPYRWLPVGILVVQNAALIIASKYCSLLSDMDMAYISLTTVLYTEILKFIISLTCCYWFDTNKSTHELATLLRKTFSRDNLEMHKLLVPSLLYVIQNNLQYLIESTALFHVIYQLKIVTTAVFFSCMMNNSGSGIDSKHKLGYKEWLCICLLCVGVSMVQISHSDFHAFQVSITIGFISVVVAIIVSGYAGVHLEKTIRSSKSSIWLINIQLSVISFVLSCILFGLVRDTGSSPYLHNYYEYQLHPFVNDTIDLGINPAALSTASYTPYFDFSLANSWTANTTTMSIPRNVGSNAYESSSTFSLSSLFPSKGSSDTEENADSSSVPGDLDPEPIPFVADEKMDSKGSIAITSGVMSPSSSEKRERLRQKKQLQKNRLEQLRLQQHQLRPQSETATGIDVNEKQNYQDQSLSFSSDGNVNGGGVAVHIARRNLRSFHAKLINHHHDITSLPAIPIHSSADYLIYVVIFLQALSGIVSFIVSSVSLI